MKTLVRLGIAIAVIAMGTMLLLLIAGPPVGVPTVFLVGAAVLMVPTLFLIGRAGVSLLREPPAEELQLATGRRRKELEREKQALLKALKELDFDYQMGKISPRDFKEFGARYRARALQVMRRLDDSTVDYRKLVEKELADRLGAKSTPKVDAPASTKTQRDPKADQADPETERQEDPISEQESSELPVSLPPLSPLSSSEALPAERPRCDNCSTTNEADATFCKRCGKPITEAAS